jgi:RNA polymerase sigma factor (sigma-70 family)
MDGPECGGNCVQVATTVESVEQAIATPARCDGRALLRQVFRRSAEALYRFILLRVAGDRDAADDLLQQTCYEAVRHQRPPADAEECEAWLRGIARNLIRRHWRETKKRTLRLPLDGATRANELAEDLESRPLPPDAVIQEESIRLLMLAITSLSAADQGLIFAYYFDGQSQAAIASDLGMTAKSIECRLFRARSRLRTILRDMERSGER